MCKSIKLSLKYISLIIIVIIGFFVAPFIFNDYSFSYFNELVFWVGIFPLILILPTLVFALFESEE
ncbi:MAG: hypothetical protein ACRCVJ_12870 [Clostridium sp.]|uniref:hypothetical protein n=1 Tax=Clostridium sp. TaxID=1506 RepID=UPI003F3BB114